MMGILDTAYESNEPVIIMCHYPIASLFNGQELLDIIDGYSNIVMWLNGHIHDGSYAKIKTIHHLGIQGMMESANAWFQMDFTSSIITVYEANELVTPKYELDIARTISISITAPTGLTKTNGILGWDIEPTSVAEIIIERRRCPTDVYEIPSTAQSLAYQVIATISVANSTQSYTDYNYDANLYYKYRIRFINGSTSSYYLTFPSITIRDLQDFRDNNPAGTQLDCQVGDIFRCIDNFLVEFIPSQNKLFSNVERTNNDTFSGAYMEAHGWFNWYPDPASPSTTP